MLYNQNNLNVAQIASKNAIRPELAGIYFTKDKTVATDGFRLIEMTVPNDQDVTAYPLEITKEFEGFIVNAKNIKDIKIPKEKRLLVLNNVAVQSVNENSIDFVTTNLEKKSITSAQRIDGTFPDYETLFPQGDPVAEVRMNAEYLVEVLNVLSKLNPLKQVVIKFYDGYKPMIITTENKTQKARAMVMPIHK